ncbi:MAG: hypothetical protein ABID61_06610 [Candidatus Micrarchaeota archaeon]
MEKLNPDIVKAAFALELALNMLDLAKEKLDSGNHVAAFEEARNSIRVTSSAILFKDGCVFCDFDGTSSYLCHTYPHIFNIRQWKRLESIDLASGPGFYNVLLKLVRKIINIEKHESKQAVLLAWQFLDSAHVVIGI